MRQITEPSEPRKSEFLEALKKADPRDFGYLAPVDPASLTDCEACQ